MQMITINLPAHSPHTTLSPKGAAWTSCAHPHKHTP